MCTGGEGQIPGNGQIPVGNDLIEDVGVSIRGRPIHGVAQLFLRLHHIQHGGHGPLPVLDLPLSEKTVAEHLTVTLQASVYGQFPAGHDRIIFQAQLRSLRDLHTGLVQSHFHTGGDADRLRDHKGIVAAHVVQLLSRRALRQQGPEFLKGPESAGNHGQMQRDLALNGVYHEIIGLSGFQNKIGREIRIAVLMLCIAPCRGIVGGGFQRIPAGSLRSKADQDLSPVRGAFHGGFRPEGKLRCHPLPEAEPHRQAAAKDIADFTDVIAALCIRPNEEGRAAAVRHRHLIALARHLPAPLVAQLALDGRGLHRQGLGSAAVKIVDQQQIGPRRSGLQAIVHADRHMEIDTGAIVIGNTAVNKGRRPHFPDGKGRGLIIRRQAGCLAGNAFPVIMEVSSVCFRLDRQLLAVAQRDFVDLKVRLRIVSLDPGLQIRLRVYVKAHTAAVAVIIIDDAVDTVGTLDVGNGEGRGALICGKLGRAVAITVPGIADPAHVHMGVDGQGHIAAKGDLAFLAA